MHMGMHVMYVWVYICACVCCGMYRILHIGMLRDCQYSVAHMHILHW